MIGEVLQLSDGSVFHSLDRPARVVERLPVTDEIKLHLYPFEI